MSTGHRSHATPVRMASVLLVLALSTFGAITIGSSPAQASHVSCGDEITAETTLDSDLLDCPNNGIVIGADDITLDLNGHMVTGDGEPFESCPEGEFCDVGVLNDGHDGVTVRNGSVREFESGVFVGRAINNRVLGISSSRNVFFGFFLFDLADSVVRDSSGSRNLPPEGDGMGLFSSHDVRIVDNSFRRNPLNPGIHVGDSTDNVIKGNLISRSAPGILIEGNRNQVRRNRCVRDGACILLVSGNGNVIARNRARRGGDGIAIENGRGNVVARNVVVDAHKTGIYLGLQQPPVGGGHNLVRRNRVRGSGRDGFAVRRKDDRSRLWRNVARGNGDDGFDVAGPSTKLTENRAINNADLGIEAVEGVIDGGGNIARSNGDPRQCTQIACS